MLRPQTNRVRSCLDLGGYWEFSKHPDIRSPQDFRAEKKVPVSCSYNELFADAEYAHWFGAVWWRKTFWVPGDWVGRRFRLYFGAVSYRAEVFMNGISLGSHEGAATPFDFDVSTQLRMGERNEIVVRSDVVLSRDTVPQGNLNLETSEGGQIAGQNPDGPFDFLPFGGIHREVSLEVLSDQAVLRELGLVTTLTEEGAAVALEGQIDGNIAQLTAIVEETGEATNLEPRDGRFTGEVAMVNPRLWRPGEGHLYHLSVELKDDEGRAVDHYRLRFGVREVRVEGSRLLVNGEPVYLRGFGKHEDFPLLGKGASCAVAVRDFELLDWVGANSFRTSHYPYADEILDLADEKGILVISETPAVSLNFEYVTERTKTVYLQLVKELHLKDRNHPSVVMWSLGNESKPPCDQNCPTNGRYHRLFGEAIDYLRRVDASRPLCLVSNVWRQDSALDKVDIVGLNVYPGWYTLPGLLASSADWLEQELGEAHARLQKPILVSEFGGDALSGQHSLPGELWSEEYQADLIEALINTMRRHSFVCGEHVWNFADFKTAQHHFRAGGNRKGVFDRLRQPKFAAHVLRRLWLDQAS